MTKPLYILILFIISLGLEAQSIKNKALIFDAYGIDEGIEVLEDTNGDYLIIGNTNSYNSEASIVLLKIDTSGSILFRKTYNIFPNYLEKAVSAKLGSNGYLYILGNTLSQNKSYQIYLLMINSDGSVLGSKTYGGSDYEFATDLETGLNNRLIISANTYSYGNGSSDNLCLITNSIGDSITSKVYGGANDDFTTDVMLFGKKIILSSKTKSYGNNSENVYIQMFNYQLDSLKSYTDTSYSNKSPENMILTNDSCFSFVGYNSDSTNTYKGKLIAKLDTNLNLLWERKVGSPTSDIVYKSHVQDSLGNYIVSGWRDDFNGTYYNVLLAKLSSSGWYIHNSSFGGTFDDYIGEIYKNSKGNLMIIGSTEDDNTSQSAILFSTFDYNLNIQYNQDSIWISRNKNIPQKSFNIYPNPAVNNFTISGLDNNKYKLQIINYQGIILKEYIVENKEKIDVSALSAGIYFIRLNGKDRVYNRKLIISK